MKLLRAIATAPNMDESDTSDFIYNVRVELPTCAAPTASVATGTYEGSINVALSCPTPGAVIHYSVDGTEPDINSPIYNNSFRFSEDTILRAMAVKDGYNNSSDSIYIYTLNPIHKEICAIPTPTVAPGSYTTRQEVGLVCPTPNSSIYYTTNGSTPTTSSTKYTTPISLSSSAVIKAIATAPNYDNSQIGKYSYVVQIPRPVPPPLQCAEPVSSLISGTYIGTTRTTLSTTTSGATIYYTTNGSNPTTSSTRYTGAITISSAMVIKAIAVKTGYTTSTVGCWAYTIQEPVKLSPVTFQFSNGTTSGSVHFFTERETYVTLSNPTAGATIKWKYSTSTTWNTYTSSFPVTTNRVVQAYAEKTGYLDSDVNSVTCFYRAPQETLNKPEWLTPTRKTVGYLTDNTSVVEQIRWNPTSIGQSLYYSTSTSGGSSSGTLIATATTTGTQTSSITVIVPESMTLSCWVVSSDESKSSEIDTAIITRTGRDILQDGSVIVHDPVAQTFAFQDNTILTKADLYFATKDENRGILVQIRNTDNGYPGPLIYASVQVPAKDVNTSADASAVTTVVFNQPVYCKREIDYCIVILADVNTYSMHKATLGEKDISTGETIMSNPEANGVLFTSSNNKTWTADQKSDLKYTLYQAHYTGKGVITFKNVPLNQVTRLIVTAEQVDYANNGISWYWRASTTSAWQQLSLFRQEELDDSVESVYIKAELDVSYSTSPILAKETVSLLSFIEKPQATYISRNITLSEDFTRIRINLDANLPSGCDMKIYYCTNGGGFVDDDWTLVEVPPTTRALSSEWTNYDFVVENLGSDKRNYRVKIVLETPSIYSRPKVRKLKSILKY